MAFGLSCPIPLNEYPVITLAHGSGGTLSHKLLRELFMPVFDNEFLRQEHDGASFPVKGGSMAITTDSFVVRPIFFPGGNIGDLAVNGTVNDLVCCGAKPMYLSAGFILEEGLKTEELWQVAVSMKQAADAAGVQIVTGDTKVVDRGSGDKIFINTTGVGMIREGLSIKPGNCMPGDKIIITGRIAEHGIAVLSARAGLAFETSLKSDTASLNGLMEKVFNHTTNIHVLRDPTRGGIATTLNEISQASGTGMIVNEENIPVSAEVQGACEILGLDPLYIANEGKMLLIVPEADSSVVLEALKDHPQGREAAIIGVVTADYPGILRMRTTIGSTRIVDMIAGEQLPRIC
jgi:hydrogenase expression/formation protein HypE